MSFVSATFIAFFAILTLLLFILPERFKSPLLLAGSYYFYCTWSVNFALLLLGVTALSYFFGLIMERETARKKALLAFAVAVTLLPLFCFKYINFFDSALVDALSCFGLNLQKTTLVLVLPLGISFYTMRVIAYYADIFGGKIAAEKNFFTYALYVSFFPQIICGPIERPGVLIPQLKAKRAFTHENFANGVKMIIMGFFKKMVIADGLSDYVANVYGAADTSGGLALIFAAFFYSVQIYCDFSGYTDIAIGLSKIWGFNLTQNFRRPYFACSIKEFWGRWHISLSMWLRDYVYIPLGGGRCSSARRAFNVMVTFLVSGLWHGANWTFIFWGALHGACIAAQNLIFPRGREGGPLSKYSRIPGIIATFCIVTLAWIFFRADSFAHAFAILEGIFTRTSLSAKDIKSAAFPFTHDVTAATEFMVMAFFIAVFFAYEAFNEFFPRVKNFGRYEVAWYAFLLSSTLLFGNFAGEKFIYAQF